MDEAEGDFPVDFLCHLEKETEAQRGQQFSHGFEVGENTKLLIQPERHGIGSHLNCVPQLVHRGYAEGAGQVFAEWHPCRRPGKPDSEV